RRKVKFGKAPRCPAYHPMLERLEDRTLLSYSSLVYPSGDGNLIYTPDALGNRIPDFSNVGYKSGIVPLPAARGGVSIPIQLTLSPTSGDQGAIIQNAINQVSQMPLDENGYRGAVLLKQGEYPINDHIEIRTSGVVLIGEGTSSSSGTRLR